MAYQHIKLPPGGEKIRVRGDFSLEVPDRPIIPFSGLFKERPA